jgi:hypothetical protein
VPNWPHRLEPKSSRTISLALPRTTDYATAFDASYLFVTAVEPIGSEQSKQSAPFRAAAYPAKVVVWPAIWNRVHEKRFVWPSMQKYIDPKSPAGDLRRAATEAIVKRQMTFLQPLRKRRNRRQEQKKSEPRA